MNRDNDTLEDTTMKKTLAILLAAILLLGILAGCTGTPVVYYCDCEKEEAPAAQDRPTAEGAVKTGLAIVAGIGESESAAKAKYDITLAAVTVDDNGVITDCVIDSIGTEITFDGTGAITAALDAEILSKNELGDSYGMKAHAGSKYEWYEQAAALADYAVGKTVEELKNGAVDESGKAPEGSDLATTATIYLGGYVSAIEKAVANAKHLGAQAGDELRLAAISSASGSKSATAEANGTAQLDCDVTAITLRDGKISSCYLDSLQAKVQFDAKGAITTDLTAPVLTKNELGDSYGMKAWGDATYEWYEQAASFAEYVTGKTADEVSGIAVSEGKATDADLAASVTISITGFQDLIVKAMQK